MASPAEPEALLPPLAAYDVDLTLGDLLFWKLADVGPGSNTFGDDGFVPKLAEGWEFEDPTTIRFQINPRARWHDGTPVTADDVAFTYEVYTDPAVGYLGRSRLASIASVTARDSLTAVFAFSRHYPEQFFDAVYHMRILPHHLLGEVSHDELISHPFVRRPVGNGPFRFAGFRRIVWRFVPDPIAIISQMIAGEADYLSYIPGIENTTRIAQHDELRIEPYEVGIYNFMGFNLRDPADTSRPHSLFGNRDLRRAISMGVDREALMQAVLGEYGRPLVGPVTQSLWVWTDDVEQISFDGTGARRLLSELGWSDPDGDGVLERGDRRLSFEVIVPASSALRRRTAVILQDQFKQLGIEMTINELEPTVWNTHATSGDFDAYLQSLAHDASPGSVAEAWSSAGIGGFNAVAYSNPRFDQLVDEATTTFDRDTARARWKQALNVINADAPAVWLFTPIGVAGVHDRIENVSIPWDEYWKSIWTWRVARDKVITRDLIAPN
jgi:peptide/nickel transport system substrate-binding protein